MIIKKNSQQTKNRREISKFSKITVNCLQDTLKAFLENRNKTRMPIMTTSIQHCTGGPRQCNQTRKRKKRCEEQKEESVPTCRWYNYIHRKSKRIYKLLELTREFSKIAEQKNQFKSCISTYQQQIKNLKIIIASKI